MSHTFFKVLIDESDFTKRVYEIAEVNTEALSQNLNSALDKIPVVSGTNIEYGSSMSQELYQLMIDAEKEEKELEDEFISTEHLLLAVMNQKEKRL
ncbi:ATP-dependent Clp protease ATP-binding subunit [Listeria fleischmannii FSL S10-1203]|uniref:ATP-dependent Clp protease ATP-binding subunit n=1 Tax=Listeria fleischmannii FSL S10-1203 TaxID=1265822 RepID=W7DN73_9LIST|nr:ATP-dependent Clp protease ATP-binding subunit [Listeria fleischmannii FSL S10-1203]